MREIIMLEHSPNFHTELLTGLLDENVSVWRAQRLEDVTDAFDVDLQPTFAIVDSEKCVQMLKEFRRWFPGVPIVKITKFTVNEHKIQVQIKGKCMVTLTFPEKNIFEKIEAVASAGSRKRGRMVSGY